MDNEDKLLKSIMNYIKYLNTTDKKLDININGNNTMTLNSKTINFQYIFNIEDDLSLRKIVQNFEKNNTTDFYIIIDLFENINEGNTFENVHKLQLTVDYLENHKMGKRLCPFSERTNNSFEIALQYFHKQFFNDTGKITKINIYILKAQIMENNSDSIKNFENLLFKCYNTIVNVDECNEVQEIKDFIYRDRDKDKLVDILSEHYISYKFENLNTEDFIFSGHQGKRNLENAEYNCNKEDVFKNKIALTFHWFYEDMARNLECSFENFNIDNENNKILIIDDNIKSGKLKERYPQVIKIIEYKFNEFNNPKIDNLKAGLITDVNNVKNLYKQLDTLEEIKLEEYNNENNKTSNLKYVKVKTDENKDKTTDLEKYRYIFVDLLIGEENLGLQIINRLRELQDYNPELKYEIIAVSRSTNTEDIQKALNFGASFYIPKERIFSIPYRIAQLGPEPPNFINVDKSFKSLARLPRRIQKQLQTSYLSYDDKNDYNWMRSLPKADIHSHFGGYLDNEITLKLSMYTVYQTLKVYSENKNFSLRFLKEDKKEIVRNEGKFLKFNDQIKNSQDLKKKLEEFLSEIYQHSQIYKKYLKELNKLSLVNKTQKSNRKKLNKLKRVDSPKRFFNFIAEKYKNDFSDIKAFHVTAFFNCFLSIEKENKKGENDNLSYLLDGEFSSKYLECLIQATHGNPIDKAIGGISLESFLKGCDYTGSDVLQTKYAIMEAIRYICCKAMDDNVYYLSLRTTPLNFCRGGLSENEVWESIKKGYDDFRSNDIKNDNYFLILTIKIALKRHYENKDLKKNIKFGLKYNLESKMKIEENKEIEYFDSKGLPSTHFYDILPFVSGFDLTGLEIDYNPQKFREEFKEIFEHCMPITIHAGEETPAKYIWEAAYELNADRIGHGLTLVKDEKLMNRFKDFNICVELCPSSNYLTQEGFKIYTDNNKDSDKNYYYFSDGKNGRDYPLKKFLKDDLGIVICTDDPAIQNTNLSKEYLWASKMTFREINGKDKKGITKWEALSIIRNGFKHCFLPYDVKSKLLRVIDHQVIKILERE